MRNRTLTTRPQVTSVRIKDPPATAALGEMPAFGGLLAMVLGCTLVHATPHVVWAQSAASSTVAPTALPSLADPPPGAAATVAPSASGPSPSSPSEAGVEEIRVTGIRQSLRSSADLKRNATGVVDAISAEDLGKFPDTNVAESLQRITGVGITRTRGGEGQFVTVSRARRRVQCGHLQQSSARDREQRS